VTVEGYDHDRRNKTWLEVHGRSRHGKAEVKRTRSEKAKNRKAGRFGKVNWDAYQHDQLYDMIMNADLGAMGERAGQWQTLASKIEGTTSDVQRTMERVMGAWEGQAAVSSAESNSKLMRWAGDASSTAGSIAQGMADYTQAVERAQRHMPPPSFATAERNFRDGYTVTGTGGPSTAVLLKELLSDGMVSHQEARARKAEAVQVMETYEAQSKDVHDEMPHFTDADHTTNQVDAWTPTPDTDPPGSPGAPPGSGPGHGSGTGVGSGVGAGSGTSAASFVAPSAGPGGLPAGGSTGGGGLPGSAFGGGLGSLGSGGSDIIRNTPGFGGLAGMGGVPGMPGRGGVGGMLPTGRGAGGPGMFGMPGGHAQGDEDKEHKNKYDEGMDFLDDLPPAYPPVFGA
jgi:PPE family protein